MTPARHSPMDDRGRLLRDIELQAAMDSQLDPRDLTPAMERVISEIDHRHDQWQAELESSMAEAERAGGQRLAVADAAAAAAADRADRSRAALRAAAADRDGYSAILRGEVRGHDAGDWSDTARLSERVWPGRCADILLYGAASVAEFGLNYLAFRLMGATPLETAVLTGGVVLVSVLLPKYLGAAIATARRTGRWKGWPALQMTAISVLWVSVMVFVAGVRSAYLVLPVGGRRPLVVTAGIDSAQLAIGWLAVALAIGLCVLVRSALRHNPYVSARRRTADEVVRLAALSEQDQDLAQQAARYASEQLRQLKLLTSSYRPERDQLRELAGELKQRYRRELMRRQPLEHPPLLDAGLPAVERQNPPQLGSAGDAL